MYRTSTRDGEGRRSYDRSRSRSRSRSRDRSRRRDDLDDQRRSRSRRRSTSRSPVRDDRSSRTRDRSRGRDDMDDRHRSHARRRSRSLTPPTKDGRSGAKTGLSAQEQLELTLKRLQQLEQQQLEQEKLLQSMRSNLGEDNSSSQQGKQEMKSSRYESKLSGKSTGIVEKGLPKKDATSKQQYQPSMHQQTSNYGTPSSSYNQSVPNYGPQGGGVPQGSVIVPPSSAPPPVSGYGSQSVAQQQGFSSFGSAPQQGSSFGAQQRPNMMPQQQGTSFPPPQQGSAFPTQQQGTNFPLQQQSAHFPPPQQGSSFPAPQQGTTFPLQQQRAPLPSQQQGSAFPPQQQGTNFPLQQQRAPFPQQQGAGFPSQQQIPPFQPQQQGSAFPPQQQGTNFPPPQQGTNFPPPQQGTNFPPPLQRPPFPSPQQGPSFPAQQQGPPQQRGPPQQHGPPTQQGVNFPPQQQGTGFGAQSTFGPQSQNSNYGQPQQGTKFGPPQQGSNFKPPNQQQTNVGPQRHSSGSDPVSSTTGSSAVASSSTTNSNKGSSLAHCTWIVGDSFVYWAGQIDTQIEGARRTYWKGKRDLQLDDVIVTLKDYLSKDPFPNTLVIHVGSCDLFREKQSFLREKIDKLLCSIRELLPQTKIIWSDILLRTKYEGESTQGGGRSSTIHLNKSTLKVCKRIGNANVIRNYQIFNQNEGHLYDEGGLNLSPEGNQVFRESLGKALVFLNTHPLVPVYTCQLAVSPIKGLIGDCTWIVGDSIAYWAGQIDTQIEGAGRTYWKGKRDLQLDDVIVTLKDYLSKDPFPNALVIHVGSCNLFSEKQSFLREKIDKLLCSIRELLPQTKIIWSDILLRTKYEGESTQGGGRSSTINLNKSALKVCKRIGNANVIRNYQIFNQNEGHLYDAGGLNLSPEGNRVFRESLEKALVFLNTHPLVPVYTCQLAVSPIKDLIGDCTWIVGDSIVYWAGQIDTQIEGAGRTYWKGKRDLQLDDVIVTLKGYLSKDPFPNALVIHVGSCNLFSEKQSFLREKIDNLLCSIRELLPQTKIFWSDILLRTKYEGESTQGGGKSSTINLNKSALKVCKRIGNAHVIRNYQIFNQNEGHLYDAGGLNLSPEGNRVFRESLGKALVFLNTHPEYLVYTCKLAVSPIQLFDR